MRFLSALLAFALSALACAAGALAHRGGSHVGFVSTVSTIDPFLPGVLVQVLGGHERLSLTNLTRKTIVILDDEERPLVRIPSRENRVWADPRIGSSEPPPDRDGLVRNWRIPGTADGERFEIVGFLGYRPPPGASGSGSDAFPTWALVLVVAGGALVLAAALAIPLRRR